MSEGNKGLDNFTQPKDADSKQEKYKVPKGPLIQAALSLVELVGAAPAGLKMAEIGIDAQARHESDMAQLQDLDMIASEAQLQTLEPDSLKDKIKELSREIQGDENIQMGGALIALGGGQVIFVCATLAAADKLDKDFERFKAKKSLKSSA